MPAWSSSSSSPAPRRSPRPRRLRLESVVTVDRAGRGAHARDGQPGAADRRGRAGGRRRSRVELGGRAACRCRSTAERDYPEETRLKYRFLDLRREKMQRNIVLRSQIIASIRRRMIEQGFTEFQTPILTASLARGCARLPGAVAAASRQVLRPAAGAAAVQAALHDLRLRPVLPDRTLLSRRGRPRRPQPGRVLPARHRDELRHPGGRVRRGRAGDARPVHRVHRLGGDADAVPAHHLPRGAAALRHRQAGPAQPDPDRRRHRGLPRLGLQGVRGCDRAGGGGARDPGTRCGRPAAQLLRPDGGLRPEPGRARAGLGGAGRRRGQGADRQVPRRRSGWQRLRAAAGLADGDAVFFVCDQPDAGGQAGRARCARGWARSWA